MRYILLVSVQDLWKQIAKSDDYNELVNKAFELPDDDSWMIVEFKRYHSGVEKQTVTR